MSIRSQEQVALLTDYDPTSAYSEAYYTLLANIRFGWGEDEHTSHSLLLTAPAEDAGQATVAANVSIAAAQSGMPVILVDADLRAPSLEQRFGLEKDKGLSDLLVEEQESPIPQEVGQYLRNTFVPGLRLLGAGSVKDGRQLLLSTKLPEVVHALCLSLREKEDRAGLVVFHSPPVLAGPDAALIGTLVDQTVLIIAKGRTTRTQAKQAQEQLQRAHARLSGLVMLDV